MSSRTTNQPRLVGSAETNPFVGSHYRKSVDDDSISAATSSTVFSNAALIRDDKSMSRTGDSCSRSLPRPTACCISASIVIGLAFSVSVIALALSASRFSSASPDDRLNALSETVVNLKAELEGLKEEKRLMQEHLENQSEESRRLDSYIRTINESLEVVQEEKRLIEVDLELIKEERLRLQSKIELMNESLEDVKEEKRLIQEHIKLASEESARQFGQIQQLNVSLGFLAESLSRLNETHEEAVRHLDERILSMGTELRQVRDSVTQSTQELDRLSEYYQGTLRGHVSDNALRLAKLEKDHESMWGSTTQYPASRSVRNGAKCVTMETTLMFLIPLLFIECYA